MNAMGDSGRLNKLRSWLFVPGHRQNMIEKALGLEVDVIIFDLEDGVPEDAKDIAREQVASALGQSSRARFFVRIHSVGHGDFDADIEAVMARSPDGLVLPKVEKADDVDSVLQAVKKIRSAVAGPDRVDIVGMIESAGGLIRAPEIAASPSVVGLMFGAEDFAQDLGMLSTGAPGEMLYARSSIVVAAASAGKFALDKIFLDVRDQDGLAEETRVARELGFVGKTLIHPGQIDVVHCAFEPTKAEKDYARRVVAAFDDAGGQGPITVDGRMVDAPVVGHARRILENNTE
jgi:citrate lyase beta subunit